MNQSLFAEVGKHLPSDLSKPFIRTPLGGGYSYADMLRSTSQFAHALVELGVQPGDRVAVQVDKSPETVMLYLAVLRVGAVYLPLNSGYTGDELRYFLDDAEPSLFVCAPAFEAQARELAEASGVARVATLGDQVDGSLMDAVHGKPGRFVDVPRASSDLAAILYTSGTTGRSKGAMISHGNLVSNARALVDAWQITGEDWLLHALPIFHIHGLFVACNSLLMAGGSMLFLSKFDAAQMLRLLPQVNLLMGVPTFYTRLLDQPGLTREAVAHMRLFISGSAPLTAETHKAFSERTGMAILERYGMTETGMNTSNPLDGERIAGTVGFPLPGVELRITDPSQSEPAPLPQGEPGMIEVRGPNVFQGYWRMPEKTAEELRADGYFMTGDIGFIDDKGYVQIVGRNKDMIISGGFNVYPKELEEILDTLPGVVESAVIGVPHPDFGEGVTAVLVATQGQAPSEAQVLAALDGKLARFKQPKRVMVVDALPRNVMGKVQKNVLREQFKALYS
ncbi:malonate--CoA ligase [Pseudomonas nitroreducens]|uniref:Malonyl-CoA synthase n=1 Tax=Pseudomonas nitroreducens TaxID=46680 RepID=A0ABS0KEI1_PSENT|nr:malonyl-CoA synthase [Pseudomonas nitroreducens]MBG6286497.1 malonyl-CoA synthase [Pseudomonas nitroreducens]MCJ1878824.1 malonyl-CoA synthase [Pseudomonas nitroreducens]MCJ1896362.1 malonyl-CoA synthase [Pseudomonas nitroreducens]MDG9852605.1 malonyl-CoA synthase [Pseudomonas nitroreducens]NMZ59721.1 malonyl-CoA synthase [Pseudomonas nitroreducens]